MSTHVTDRQTPAHAARRAWPPRLARVAPYLGVALVTVVLGLPTLILPLHPDQALFVMMGKAVARGDVLYVDVWDVKPPAIYLLYALATRLPFDAALSVRLFDLGWTAITAALIVALGRRYWSLRVGLFAALIFALVWSTNDPWSQSAQPDSLVVLPLALGLLLYEMGGRRRWWLVATGAVFGIAFQLRFTIALLLPMLPFVDLAVVRRPARQMLTLWWQRMAWTGVGFTALQVLVLLYLAAGGALGEFIATMRYAGAYTRLGGPWNTPEGPELTGYFKALRTAFWTWAEPRLLLVLPALAAGAYGWFAVRERRVQQVVLFAVLTYAGIAMQAKFFWYHFSFLPLFLALLGGWGWDRLYTLLRRTRSMPAASVTAGALAGLLLLASTEVWDSGIRHWSALNDYRKGGSEAREAYRATFAAYPTEMQTAGYIRAHTSPDDAIVVWGFDPLVYLEAERTGASRFLVVFPLMSNTAPQRWQREFVAELERARPAYVVIQRAAPGNWLVGHNLSTLDYIERFPAFQELLARDYVADTEIGVMLLYRRVE